jgi:hypothetical protein
MNKILETAAKLNKCGYTLHCSPSLVNVQEVWLDTNLGEYDGLCLGRSFAQAERVLRAALALIEAIGSQNEVV